MVSAIYFFWDNREVAFPVEIGRNFRVQMLADAFGESDERGSLVGITCILW